MSEYVHPSRDTLFVLDKVIGFEALCGKVGADVNSELAAAIIEEAGKLGAMVLGPLNSVGDRNGPRLTEKGVEQTAGFAEAYQLFCEGGWCGLNSPEAFGGQNLPQLLATAVNEVWHSANMAFALCPLLSQGAIAALAHHANEPLKQVFLPPLISGEWTGTMNLTEPDSGSDLAAIKSRAVPCGDHYLITGQKIFISWGDHQMTDNILHLVLAKLPGAPAGVKGLSLFLVPKYTLEGRGLSATRNDVSCVALEHKLGIHGSPTCVMSFGDEGGAVGYLIGEENTGLACMFTMMNHARQAVGLQGLAISERAYQAARAYARERLQGTRKDGSRFPIIQFADVRRMLMQMKSSIEAMRALALIASAEQDLTTVSDPSQAAFHQARVDLFTPIVKGWLTELAQEVTSLAVQVHGGMGYIEETGVAQYLRDARILPIYEGTTGIQAQDLIGRKTIANAGVTLSRLLDDIGATLAELRSNDRCFILCSPMAEALQAGQRARDLILQGAATDSALAGTLGVNFMMLFGYLAGGWALSLSALAAAKMLNDQQGDQRFAETKLITARFYMEHLLPRTQALLITLSAGSQSSMALPEECF